ncbi:EAL domain-containing protein [Labrenzia sp. CE80]|uniref:putative bifunctional diguanylate cyclase/phosphodiesterase n=1 Tax=Labrenzia sp. CE80 TaxID=1788986 RepID=UPI00129B1594|nr:EAL domain-containing protein [Labrenzia sp. CE80]
MFAVLSSIATEYHVLSLAAASVLGFAGCLFTIKLYGRVNSETGARRRLCLFLASIACASSIWGTHFITMIGHEPAVEHTFDVKLTILSFIVAFMMSGIGLFLATLRSLPLLIELGGLVVGLGIAAMHFTGMAAIIMPGVKSWDPGLIATSVVLGSLFGALALNRFARPGSRYRDVAASFCLMAAILCVHFIGMTSVTVIPVSGVELEPAALDKYTLLATVVLALVVLMLVVAAGYAIDAQGTRAAAEKYRYLALHDPITGLPNRQYLSQMISSRLAEMEESSNQAAVLFISLDQFKAINDLHGYGAGDEVLSAVSANILGNLAEDELLARFNGDEFVAFKGNVPNLNAAMLFAYKIREIILQPIHWNNYTLNLHASIGIAMFPDDSTDLDTLVLRAALAAKRAKRIGGHQIKTYVEGMEEANRRQAVIAADLKSAVSDGQLRLYVQPQNDARTMELIGYEALLRWEHPEKGLIGAADFIPIAERTGQILDIGQWVLEAACQRAISWDRSIPVSVNASPLQLSRSNYPAIVSQILIETGLPAERLEIELTESSIIEDHDRVLDAINALRDMGVRVSMDDFGTGYSSLNTLQNFPFDKIKVDRVFTQSIETDPRSRAIIRSAVLLGHSFKIPVLAEGVENKIQLDFLTEAGCAQVQGFLFGRPMPASDVPSNSEQALLTEELRTSLAETRQTGRDKQRVAS